MGCLLPAEAARQDALQVRLNDLDARLANLERILANDSLLELARRIDALETQLREQRGAGEELQNDAQQLRRQQRDLYADLEARLARLEQGVPGGGATLNAAAGGAGAGAPVASAGSGDQPAYDAAFDKLRSGDYAAAIEQFGAMLKNFPNSALLDNAQYWLGEAYYVTRSYEPAASAFRTVLQRWPDSRKAPDAMLKLGYTLYELKKFGEARTTLQQVQTQYAGSNASRLANERLARMASEMR